MAFLRELVESPALTPLLEYVSRPTADPVVLDITFVEDLGHLERTLEHSIALLTRAVSAAVSSPQFDMALRVARSRKVAALVMSAADVRSLTSATMATAQGSGTAILVADEDADLAALALAIGRELAGDAGVALMRAHTAIRAIDAHPPDGSTESLVHHVGAALGVPISMTSSEPAEQPYRAIVVEDRVEGWIAAPRQGGDLEMGVEIVLQAVVASVADALTRNRRSQELPTQSRREVLTDFLSAPSKTREQVALRARNLGFPIDSWHVAVRLDFENLTDPPAGQELTAYRARAALGAAALQAARAAGGTWHEARAGDAFVLINSYQQDPGPSAARAVARTMDEVLVAIRGRLPGAIIRCGVGIASAGPGGLLASLAEARAATIAARTSRRTNVAVAFDSLGLRRAVVEWYASDTAREVATSVLEPLAALGGIRSDRLIQTLHVYLDERGSLTRAAQRLNLHRNTVAYRINRAFQLLDVEQDNPDDLLLLQLACRARELN